MKLQTTSVLILCGVLVGLVSSTSTGTAQEVSNESNNNIDGSSHLRRAGGVRANRGLRESLRGLSFFNTVSQMLDDKDIENQNNDFDDENFQSEEDFLNEDTTPGIFLDDHFDGHGRRLASFTCYPKMRWVTRSRWQEETKETKWCMKVSGSYIRLRHCPSKRSKMRFRSDGTIRRANKSSKCLTRSGTPYMNKGIKGVYLRTCNGSSSQKFRISGSKSKFAIRQGDYCMSSQHHPKDGERVGLSPWSWCKRDRTRYWKCD